MSIIHSIVNHVLKSSKRIYDPNNPHDYKCDREKEIQQNKHAQAPKSVIIQESVMGGVQVETLTKICILLYVAKIGFLKIIYHWEVI